MKKIFLHILFIALIYVSCEKIRQLPPEPFIEFRQFTMFDTIDTLLGNQCKAGILEFYFEDGDGDLGLGQDLSGTTDTTNLLFTLFRKIDGTFAEAEEDDVLKPPFKYRIPLLDRTGQNQVLQGTIEITFFYLLYNPEDTIRYDFIIEDRAGNISNTATSCEIPFTLDGPCIIIVEEK
ncbi:MAG: hypothetical protein K8R35_04760 [Bacteroidales bacterium]|nr:hypothetical protein [Bacteroidales bacterium]